MKVTSQIRSPTCVTPTFWPAKTWLRFLPALEANPAALRHRHRLVVKRIGHVLQAAIDARGRSDELHRAVATANMPENQRSAAS
jgi:hypothetical protein